MISLNNATFSNTALRQVNQSSQSIAESIQKLSTGQRISSASSDVAGLSTSVKLSSAARGMAQADRNISEAIDYLKTVDGMMSELTEVVLQAKESLVHSSSRLTNDWNGSPSHQNRINHREFYLEFSQSVTQILNATDIKGDKYLDNAGLTVQMGADASDTFEISITGLNTTNLGIRSGPGNAVWYTFNYWDSGRSLINTDRMLDIISGARGEVGAAINALSHQRSNLGAQQASVEASAMRITDADYALETAELARQQVKQQASTSVLAQGNVNGQLALQLIRG